MAYFLFNVYMLYQKTRKKKIEKENTPRTEDKRIQNEETRRHFAIENKITKVVFSTQEFHESLNMCVIYLLLIRSI